VSNPGVRPALSRRLGLGGATAIGLAAMLGTGVFAAWTPALRWAGGLLLVALTVAAVIASLNAWSTAALAARHPEAGGVYAYGRARLGRAAGLIAGASFVVGKVASAGAAALTVGTYLWADQARPVAVAAIVVVLALDLRGVTRTALASAISAGVVIAVLLAVSLVGAGAPSSPGVVRPTSPGVLGVVAASGLLFVAFAGYARIATLGEEVREPERVLPRAIALALGVVLAVYVAVGLVVVRVIAPLPPDDRSPAPIAQLAQLVSGEAMAGLVRVAAVVAAGGALLSLLAGVGRTVFAMARGGDAPRALSAVSRFGVPHRAQLVAGVGAALVALVGGIGGALALSGVSILTYYGIAHLAALRLGRDEGRPPRAVPVLGLVGCVVVAVSLVLVGLGIASPA
jgi:APA family basic amino acid/polyamine antiporter